MKQARRDKLRGKLESPPAREAWIETLTRPLIHTVWTRSPPAREAWIETNYANYSKGHLESPPARAAWVETRCPGHPQAR